MPPKYHSPILVIKIYRYKVQMYRLNTKRKNKQKIKNTTHKLNLQGLTSLYLFLFLLTALRASAVENSSSIACIAASFFNSFKTNIKLQVHFQPLKNDIGKIDGCYPSSI
jgi:hypothetical protein